VASALTITIPHALGLGLLAFAAFGNGMSPGSLALWSAALPGALLTLMVRGKGVIYAPSTVVALLFGGMLALVMSAGREAGITILQGLAITGAFVSAGFGVQWLIGRAGLATLSRFLPVAVLQGFGAGVGLSLMVSPLRQAWTATGGEFGELTVAHFGLILLVVVVSLIGQRLSARFPGILLGMLAAAAIGYLALPSAWLIPADQPYAFALPPVPDWSGAPWILVLQSAGAELIVLSLLLGIVNSLDVLVFHQSLDAEHAVKSDPGRVLMKEAQWSGLCGLLGMIPASTSSSRSRIALRYSIRPTDAVGHWHALILVGVAVTGHWWIHYVPVACLAGALVVAGARMLPNPMLTWRMPREAIQRETWWQSWTVASLFVYSGGALALVAGLVVATVTLLRSSASHAVRRMHLDGRLRSRHIRPTAVAAWLAERMNRVAVFEVQGIMSFGVAASVVDQVQQHLGEHRWVIMDTSRVPAWDDTGYERLRVLARDLQRRGVTLVLCGLGGQLSQRIGEIPDFADLDHALEWAESCILASLSRNTSGFADDGQALGELTVGIPTVPLQALRAVLVEQEFAPGQIIIAAGDTDRTLLAVRQGHVTVSTAPPGVTGVRLAVIGSGMIFGEMAFLNGIARTAYVYAGDEHVKVVSLSWQDFQNWCEVYPECGLTFMSQLARMGIVRLGTTTAELRAAME